jgi:pimeloyl-ACP methyl ester carboxylesterase
MSEAIKPSSDAITPFKVDIPQAELDSLKSRLANTRWPEREVVADWSQGIPLAYTQELAAYWAEDYDWRRWERKLNSWDQFTTEIDGATIHFLHIKSPHPNALPLVITHGWPGSIVEFHKVIEPLTNPDNPEHAFHLVVPSIPGYGFSGKPTAAGTSAEEVGKLWGSLMARLGYDRYVAQGGDWGALITQCMGITETAHCAAIHVTLAMGARPILPEPGSGVELSDAARRTIERLQFYRDWDSGYSKQQATRPQTLGYGLVDSPAGQHRERPNRLCRVSRRDRSTGTGVGRGQLHEHRALV